MLFLGRGVLLAGLIILLLAGPSFASGETYPQTTVTQSWWPEVFPRDPHDQNKIDWAAIELARLIPIPENASWDQRIDIVRNFIAENSTPEIDSDFYSYWYDPAKILQFLQARAKSEMAYKPHMDCSTRAVVMYNVLKVMGVHARMAIVYPDDDSNVSHTYLGVYNPITTNWEIQDPYFNVFWKFKDSGVRASTPDLLAYPIKETFVPCRSEKDCGYTPTIEKALRYYSMASVLDLAGQNAPIFVNPSRYNMDRLFVFYNATKQYCSILSKGCEQNIVTIQNYKK